MKKNQLLVIITILVFVGIVAAIVVINNQLNKAEQLKENIPIENQPVIGDADAPVTIIEFGDYKCPGCGFWSENVYPQLKEEYIDTGKVKLAFINVLFHGDESLLASLASEAVYKQDPEVFWDFHEGLFETLVNLDHNASTVTLDFLLDVAEKYAPTIDLEQLEQDMTSEATFDEVKIDNDLVAEYNIQSTPTIIINDVLVDDPFKYDDLKKLIEKGLK